MNLITMQYKFCLWYIMIYPNMARVSGDKNLLEIRFLKCNIAIFHKILLKNNGYILSKLEHIILLYATQKFYKIKGGYESIVILTLYFVSSIKTHLDSLKIITHYMFYPWDFWKYDVKNHQRPIILFFPVFPNYNIKGSDLWCKWLGFIPL